MDNEEEGGEEDEDEDDVKLYTRTELCSNSFEKREEKIKRAKNERYWFLYICKKDSKTTE